MGSPGLAPGPKPWSGTEPCDRASFTLFAAKFLLHCESPRRDIHVCRFQICRTLRFLAEILINNWLSWFQNDWEMTWENVCWKSSQTRRPGELSFIGVFAKRQLQGNYVSGAVLWRFRVKTSLMYKERAMISPKHPRQTVMSSLVFRIMFLSTKQISYFSKHHMQVLRCKRP